MVDVVRIVATKEKRIVAQAGVAVVEEVTKLKSMGCHWRYGQQREGHSEAANGSMAICDKANMAKEAKVG